MPKINFYKCKLPRCNHFSFHANTWSIYLLWPVAIVFYKLTSYVISIFGGGGARGRRCCDSGKIMRMSSCATKFEVFLGNNLFQKLWSLVDWSKNLKQWTESVCLSQSWKKSRRLIHLGAMYSWSFFSVLSWDLFLGYFWHAAYCGNWRYFVS